MSLINVKYLVQYLTYSNKYLPCYYFNSIQQVLHISLRNNWHLYGKTTFCRVQKHEILLLYLSTVILKKYKHGELNCVILDPNLKPEDNQAHEEAY